MRTRRGKWVAFLAAASASSAQHKPPVGIDTIDLTLSPYGDRTGYAGQGKGREVACVHWCCWFVSVVMPHQTNCNIIIADECAINCTPKAFASTIKLNYTTFPEKIATKLVRTTFLTQGVHTILTQGVDTILLTQPIPSAQAAVNVWHRQPYS